MKPVLLHIVVVACCVAAPAGLTELPAASDANSAFPPDVLRSATQEVHGYQGALTFGANITSRSSETIYDNTDLTHFGGNCITQVFGFAPSICSEFGDVVETPQRGVIDGIDLAIYNSSGSAVDLCSVDVIVNLYIHTPPSTGHSIDLLTIVDLGTVSLEDIGCLAPGYFVTLSVNGIIPTLSKPASCSLGVTQRYANARTHGGAAGPTNAGTVLGMSPVVGEARGFFLYTSDPNYPPGLWSKNDDPLFCENFYYGLRAHSLGPCNDVPPMPKMGDVNCDERVDMFDIDPFVLALASAPHSDPFDDYYVTYPDCDPLRADVNGDGSVDLHDVDSFAALLSR